VLLGPVIPFAYLLERVEEPYFWSSPCILGSPARSRAPLQIEAKAGAMPAGTVFGLTMTVTAAGPEAVKYCPEERSALVKPATGRDHREERQDEFADVITWRNAASCGREQGVQVADSKSQQPSGCTPQLGQQLVDW